MTEARERRVTGLMTQGVTRAEAETIDDHAQAAVEVAIQSGARSLADLPPKLRGLAYPAFLGATVAAILATREEMMARIVARRSGSVQ